METGRLLHARLREHFGEMIVLDVDSKLTSNFFQAKLHANYVHKKNSPQYWKVEILSNNLESQKRKILEAEAIKSHKPNLNLNKGISLII